MNLRTFSKVNGRTFFHKGEFLKKLNGVIAASTVTLFWGSLSHAQVVSGQSYRIFSACDLAKVMAVEGTSSTSLLDNARIVLQTEADAKTTQIFKFETFGTGYKITAKNSGKVFNIAKASTQVKAGLEQYKLLTGSTSEQFKVSSTSDGYSRLQNVNSGLYVNLINASTVEGTAFEQYSSTTACAEKFKLVAVAATAPSPTPTPTPTPTPAPTPTPTPTPTPRDPLKQPFASNSIWNMPIGSGAQYVAANLSGTPGNNVWAAMPGADEEHLILTPTAPLVTVNYSSVGWSGGDRCVATAPTRTIASVPMPSTYVIPNNNKNTAVVSLMPDNRSLVQLQPVARCTAGGPATALVTVAPVDLYGDGRAGAHGGSGLSSIGGSIRLGELRPGSAEGPRHALKVNVYAKEALYRCSVRTDCYRWPASTSDSYAVGFYGTANNNSNTAMKMGSLLAIPPSVNIGSMGLETVPGKQLAWTFQNYGAYIVDDAYAPGFDISIEAGPNGRKADEFQRDYGFAFTNKVNYQSSSPWVRDIQRLVQALHVVNNNTATTIGGGGVGRQPAAAPIAP
jgi:hypothetical protein